MTRSDVRWRILAGALGLSVAFGGGPARAGVVISTSTGGQTVTFGNVLVGRTATGAITARNTGTSNVQVTFGVPSSSPPFARAGSNSGNANVARNGGTASRDYTFTPQARGVAGGTASVATPDGTVAVGLQGRGVAPVNEVSATQAGPTRIGTTGTATLTVTNTGDGNLSGLGAASNLNGTVQGPFGSGTFAGPAAAALSLGDGQSQSFTYLYTPTGRSVDEAGVFLQFSNGSSDGRNLSQSVVATLGGRGVGPDFRSSADSLDFGTIDPGQSSSLELGIANATIDPDGGDANLTNLTLIAAELLGPDAGSFSIQDFVAGTVLAKGSGGISLSVGFLAGLATGSRSATLRLYTDQGAAFGAWGQYFDIELRAAVADAVLGEGIAAVPEPSSLALGLVGIALAGSVRLRGRSRRRAR